MTNNFISSKRKAKIQIPYFFVFWHCRVRDRNGEQSVLALTRSAYPDMREETLKEITKLISYGGPMPILLSGYKREAVKK